MRTSVSVLPFKADLLINNRSKNQALKQEGNYLKDDFKSLTSDVPNLTLILSSNKDVFEDSFELINSRGKVLAGQKFVFSKYIGSLNHETLVKRLLDIYELLTKKAKYSLEITKLQEKRIKHYITLKQIAKDKTLTSAQRDKALLYQRHFIEVCDDNIKAVSNSAKSDCDSFEITHNLKKNYI